MDLNADAARSVASVWKNLCKNDPISARPSDKDKIREFGEFTKVNHVEAQKGESPDKFRTKAFSNIPL
jgi:hypothetical protein